MAKSTKTKKTKKFKRKTLKVSTLIIIILLIAFVVYCYFNPEFYNNLLKFINGDDDTRTGDGVLIGEINKDNYYATIFDDLNMVVHFIDIGQGDAIFIEFPDSKNMLIDAGDNNKENNDKLVDYIQELNVDTIDYIIATHADADHIGGMDAIFDNFFVKKVYRPYVYYSGDKYNFDSSYNKGGSKYKQSSSTYGGFLNDILDETYVELGITKSCEWEFFTYFSDFGVNIISNNITTSYTVDFLSPTKELSTLEYKDANDYSPIIKISYGEYDIMFTGDAETECELDFVNSYSISDEYKSYVDVELLKVGHHGSGTSSQIEFLNLINPEISIISCGEGNSYGHPHQSALDRLLAKNSIIYRTDNNGDIVLTIDVKGDFVIDTQRNSTTNHLAPSK